MDRIVLDFESYYDQEYSLRKMTPIQYCLDERWETIGCAVKVNGGETFWLDGDEVANYLRGLSAPYAAISHNGLFDFIVLAFRYGIHPKLLIDTMGMARALIAHGTPRGSVSLDTCARHLGLGLKGTTVHNVKGMRHADIVAAGLMKSYSDYSCLDADLCWGVYEALKDGFTAEEFVVNDMLLRMASQPQFTLDVDKLYAHLGQVQEDKQTLLDRIGIDKSDLMSDAKFAQALEALGVVPETKLSEKKSVTAGHEVFTYAFAKTDPQMVALEEHPDPDVQALVAARVGHKSTLEETRTQRFIDIAQVTFDGNESWMPIALRMSGAHTHRFSGDWKLNQQNLPSRNGTMLRQSLTAPAGHVVMTVDAAQIEARLNAWICGEAELVAQFANGDDIYSIFASDIYGYIVIKKQHPKERFLGKTSILGLGFQMGAPKFQNTVRVQAAQNHVDIEIDLEEAKRVVGIYRGKYRNIAATWKWLNELIPSIKNGQAEGMTFGPMTFEKGAILGPNGLRLFYDELQYKDRQWTYYHGGKRKHIYGGKILENIIQFLDRVCVMDAAVRIKTRVREERLPLAHQLHDELVYVPRLEYAPTLRQIMMEEMCRRPSWGPDLPLAAEVGEGPNYGEAK